MLVRHRVIAILAAAVLLAGCSSGPVSQATTDPGSAAPGGETPGPADTSPTSVTEPPSTFDLPTPSPAPTPPIATPTDVPPKPGSPTFTLVRETPKAAGGSTVDYEITWTSPAGLADKFFVYGVVDCLRYSKQYDGKPCVVKGMKIPRTSLELIASAPGDARKVTVSWDLDEIGPGPYWSILMRATNSFGDSIFTIVHTDNVCFECTY